VIINKERGQYNVHGQKATNTFDNTSQGLKAFIKDYKDILSDSLTVLETTGGYESLVLKALVAKGYAAHPVDARDDGSVRSVKSGPTRVKVSSKGKRLEKLI
tara:strand:- start:28049 stop:28354 length:306 start_codon:yes stop_codon:yes gene_type:complete